MTEKQPTWAEMELPEREAFLRRRLAVIRNAWPILLDPPPPSAGAGRSVPSSKIPTSTDALSLRVEIGRDLAFWTHALLEDHPEGREVVDGPQPLGDVPIPTTDPSALPMWKMIVDTRPLARALDLTDTLALIDHLLHRELAFAAYWTFGERLAYEIDDLALEAARFAWPRHAGEITLGDCTNTVGAEGVAVQCGTKVRVRADHPSDVKCRGCGLTDTIDGWILRIVGDEPLVTAEQLVPILHKRMGIVVARSTIRSWKHRGELPAAGVDEQGRDLFDRQHAFLVVTRREARRAAGAAS